MTAPTKLIAGNWKMNGLRAATAEFDAIIEGLRARGGAPEALICPPATLLAAFAEKAMGAPLAVGAQDCHVKASGAHTGDLSAEMIADAGGAFAIVGHSERRADHGEGDALVRAKAEAARRAGLTPIICVGETEAERVAGTAVETVAAQVAGGAPDGGEPAALVLAYEPVWAIGTGRTPTTDDIAEMHAALRAQLIERFGAAAAGARLLYGGSVKPANAAEILAVDHVDGALIGGASLKAADFLAIYDAA